MSQEHEPVQGAAEDTEARLASEVTQAPSMPLDDSVAHEHADVADAPATVEKDEPSEAAQDAPAGPGAPAPQVAPEQSKGGPSNEAAQSNAPRPRVSPLLIGAGVVALVLVALVAWFMLARPAAPSGESSSAEQSQAGSSSSGGEQATQNASTQRTYGPGTLDHVEPTWLDVNKVPTIRALVEAEGWQLETLMQQQGWVFDESLEWLLDPLDAGLSVTGVQGRYDDAAIAELPAGGGQNPAVYLLTLPAKAYETAEAAFSEVAQVSIEQQQWFNDMGIAVVVAPSQVKYFVLCVPDADGSYHSIMVFNVAALESGLFNQLAGASYGTTPNEVFNNMLAGMLAN